MRTEQIENSTTTRAFDFLAGRYYIPTIGMVNFTLTYDGRIPSASKSARVEEKQAIRRAFHPQLRAWVETGPLASTFKEVGATMWQTILLKQPAPFSDFKFLPIVTKFLNVVCELDVLLLRPEEPGRVIKNDGDIDNRLKTLFDALRMPLDKGEIPKGDGPTDNERPHFYCLLEDDALITKVTLRGERLLALNRDPDSVRLIIGVTMKGTHLTNHNFPIGT